MRRIRDVMAAKQGVASLAVLNTDCGIGVWNGGREWDRARVARFGSGPSVDLVDGTTCIVKIRTQCSISEAGMDGKDGNESGKWWTEQKSVRKALGGSIRRSKRAITLFVQKGWGA